MATVAVTFDGTRISHANDENNGGTWDKWGATQSPTQESDFFYQGTACISNKVSNTTGGIDFDATTAIDFSSPNQVVLAKVNVTTYGLIDGTVHKGAAYQVGSSGSDYYDFYQYGQLSEYPIKGGWVIMALDPNEVAYRAATVGTPDLNNTDYFGWWADITAIVKSENVMHDALEYMASVGDGLTLVGGDSTDPDGVFLDFVTEDEGDVANRWGVVQSFEGAIVVTGTLNIGTTTATVFTDSGAVVIWTESCTADGFNGLAVAMSHASTDVTISDSFFSGNGRGFQKDFIHTITDVDATGNIIDLHAVFSGSGTLPWADLDYVTYSKEGGTDAIGLTDATNYWIRYDTLGGTGYAIYSSLANAGSDTSRIVLSDGSTGENHSFKKVIDTRPDMTVTGTTGVKCRFDGCSFDNFHTLTLTSKADLLSCKMTKCEALVQAGGDIDGCTISAATTEDGVAILEADDLDLVVDNAFTFSNGHAIRVRPTGAGPFTYTLDGNTFTGYGADDSTDAALLIDPVTASADITINVVNASTPTYTEAAGYTGTAVVQQSVILTITVTDNDNNDAVIENAQTSVHRTDTGAALMNEDTNASGIATESVAYSSPVEVVVRVRKSDELDSPRYFPFSSIQTVDGNGLTLSVGMDQNPFI